MDARPSPGETIAVIGAGGGDRRGCRSEGLDSAPAMDERSPALRRSRRASLLQSSGTLEHP
jgi:hypothetical protein